MKRRVLRSVLTCDHTQDYTSDELEFLRAVDRYRTANSRPFPTHRELLAILVSLGYRKVVTPVPLPVFERGGTGRRRNSW